MRQQDRLHLDIEVADSAHQLIDLVAGIDDHRLASPLAADDKAILKNGPTAAVSRIIRLGYSHASADRHRRL